MGRGAASIPLGMGLVLGMVAVGAIPAYAYEMISGTRSCATPRSASVFSTGSLGQHHYYAQTNENTTQLVWDSNFHYLQSYSSATNTYWYAEAGGSLSGARGSTCV
jgi:hypothetical protein